MSLLTTNPIDNFELNKSTDISCKEDDIIGTKLMSGVSFTSTNNKIKINSAKCSNLKLGNDIMNLKKGAMLNELCDCESVDQVDNNYSCPNNTYLRSYFPNTGKILCCSPCNSSNNLMVKNNARYCKNIYTRANNINNQCPQNSLITGFKSVGKDIVVNCCKPFESGQLVDQQNALNQECKSMGLDSCSASNIQELKNNCKKLGLIDCNKTNIENLQKKCDSYGMKYFDLNQQKYINSDSYLDCYINNFSKMDEICKNNSIDNCNWYNLSNSKLKTLQLSTNNINNLEKIQNQLNNNYLNNQNMFEEELVILNNKLSKKQQIFWIVLGCFSIILIIIIVIIIINWLQR